MTCLTLYTRPGCHLCDRAKAVLHRCRQQFPFDLREVDITSDPDLLARYGEDIPVILMDGTEIARHFIWEQQLIELLRRKTP